MVDIVKVGWACTIHPHQAGLIWMYARRCQPTATLCVLHVRSHNTVPVPSNSNHCLTPGVKFSSRECKAYCKKSLVISPSLAGLSLTKHSLAGNYLIIPGQGEFGLWHRWGREIAYLFLQCTARGGTDVVQCTVDCKSCFLLHACGASLAKLITSLSG
jgi:hypothetical protein